MTLPLFDLPPAEARIRIREIIAAHSATSPASIAYIRERTGLSERAIKACVEELRVGGAPICARRGQPCGYFWASTDQDIRDSVKPMRNQARKMFLVIGRMLGSKAAFDLLGQLRLELEQEFSERQVRLTEGDQA